MDAVTEMAAKGAWPTAVLRWLVKPSGPRRNTDGQLTRVLLKCVIKSSRIHERRLKCGKSRSVIVTVWMLSVHPSASLSILLCLRRLKHRCVLCCAVLRRSVMSDSVTPRAVAH